MKLIVIIPCLNEAATLPVVLKTIPKKITGIDKIEIVVIDDGSTDKTVEVAKMNGVKHFVSHIKNQGLSVSFCDGLNQALKLGADIIVLTDGDNQYPQKRIPDLIEPILKHKADLVIADRQIQTIDHFSATKKMWQRFGTWVMNLAAGTNVPDGTSGFRAYSRDAALQLNLIAKYSFATETTIQAGNKGQAIAFIKIKTNAKTRESRQFTSSWQHVRKSSITIMRGFVMYKPYAVFFSLGLLLLVVGLIPFIHYFVLYFSVKSPGGAHHLQSLIIGTVLLTASFISFTLGVIADLIRINRRLLEDILEHTRRNDFSKHP
ncbi:MAG TPA: glycosyltransferase family 2 protein [Patescibacteria group bacterium]|nr:glycosyltransferase family 2 protein [Patescibacteria group bacterium]